MKQFFKNIKELFSYDKRKFENILEDPNNKFWNFFNGFIILLIIFSVFILILESFKWLWPLIRYELYIADFFISFVFWIEYLYRLFRAKNKVSFVKDILNIIDLLAFVLFFLVIAFFWVDFSINSVYMASIRLIRIFRILKLAKHIPVMSWFLKALKDYKNEYKWIFITLFIILTVVSILIFEVENKANPIMFSSIPQAFWWSIVTMTTVWYWDIYPITALWKIIWSVLILLWPILIAVVSSVTILVFMEVVENQKLKSDKIIWKTCSRCNSKNLKRANYCMVCGKKFPEVISKEVK